MSKSSDTGQYAAEAAVDKAFEAAANVYLKPKEVKK